MTQRPHLFRVGGVPEPWHGSPYRNPRETFSIPRHYLVGTHPPTAKEPTMTSVPRFRELAQNLLTTKTALGLSDEDLDAYLAAIRSAMAHGTPPDLLEAAIIAHTQYGMTAQDLERLAAPITITAHDPTAKDKPMDTKSDVYTASNGTEVHIDDRGYLLATGGTGEFDAVTQATGGADFGVQALREFFQHERDLELGRWRDPADTDMVCYPIPRPDEDGTRGVVIVNERTGESRIADDRNAHWHGDIRAIAARYFTAHPEPKPWESAEEGEMWLITCGTEYKNAPAIVKDGNFYFPNRYGDGLDFIDLEGVMTATRIWPQESDDE